MNQPPLPKQERELRGIRVVFDVGARTDMEYLEIKPRIELHAFEPNPQFFKVLLAKAGYKKNVRLNNYGLGDSEGDLVYQDGRQSFIGSEAVGPVGHRDKVLPIKTLDWYVEKYGIKRIDFLKIDTEGYDYKILKYGIKERRYADLK